MKTFLINISILIVIITNITTQIFSQSRAMKIPESFVTPFENVDLFMTKGKAGVRVWIVFSDRDNNKTHSTDGGTDVFKTIGFLEVFNVMEESSNMLHIVKVSDENLNNTTYEMKQYDDYGWIEKTKLLLWTDGLVSSKTGVNKKVMILNSVDWAKEVKKGDKPDILTFCKNPELSLKTDNNAQMFQIFYIYKFNEDKTSILVGKTSRISDSRYPKVVIVGWAPKNRIYIWDNRVAIEPNWHPEAVSERKSKGYKCMIFRDKKDAEQFSLTGKYAEDRVLWNDDQYTERKIGNFYRFPVYDIESTTNIIYNGYLPSPQNDTIVMNTLSTISELAENGISNDQLEILKKTNFQFVANGYTAIHPKALKYPLFQFVIFITRTEFGEIVSDLSRLLQKKSGIESRQHLQDTFKKLLEEHLGEAGTKNLEKKSVEEITKLLFGLPSLSPFIKDINWITITEPSLFTDDMLTGWINEIERKFKILKKIQNEEKYKYSFELNDEVYYWISQQNLP